MERRRRTGRYAWACGVGAAAAACASVLGQVGTFTPLGDLPGDVFHSRAADVSAEGLVVVGASRSHRTGLGRSEAVVWRLSREGPAYRVDSVRGLGAFRRGALFSSEATGVSGDGSVIVGFSAVGRQIDGTLRFEAFRCAGPSPMRSLGVPQGRDESAALAVSRDGVWIAGRVAALFQNPAAALHDGEGWIETGTPEYNIIGRMQGVANGGAVAVGSENAPFHAKFVVSRDGGRVEDFADGGGRAVTPDGRFACGVRAQVGGPSTALLVEFGGAMIDLGTPVAGKPAVAVDLADHGRVVLVNCDDRSWVWDAYTARFHDVQGLLAALGVDTAGWSLNEPRALSADGRVIVGSGINADGVREAWHVSLPYPCVADHDRDGTVGTLDAVAFLADFAAGRPDADVDYDGAVTGADALVFLNAFAGGC